MLLLILCVLVNAFIGVIFKYFDRYEVEAFPAIVINYAVCVVTGSLVLGEFPIGPDLLSAPWLPYAVVLSSAFIGTFTLMAYTVRGFGIVVATIFQKMSLLAPTLLGILIFHESAGMIKIIGLALAVASIFVITKSDDEPTTTPAYRLWIYPIVVFAGSCIIDVLLYYVNRENIMDSGDIRFVITLFFCSFMIGSTVLLYQLLTGKVRITKKTMIAGVGLGVPNLFSIYLLVLVLSQGLDGSVVFPINNVGILAISAVLGIVIFGEKMGQTKLSGLAMAIAAIILIAYG